MQLRETVMRAGLIRIGNSRGIRIPKPLIEQCGFGDEVEVRVERDRLIITQARRPRQGWAEAFRAAGSSEKDELLLDRIGQSDFDREDWRW
jgi:antitoxin MazE